MARNFTIDDVVRWLNLRGGYNVTFGGGVNRGIGLARKQKPTADNNMSPWETLGFISQIQQDQYENSSQSAEECAKRIEAHIVHKRRSDIDLTTQALLDEQAARLSDAFRSELASLRDLISAGRPPATPAVPDGSPPLPPSATEIPVPPPIEAPPQYTEEQLQTLAEVAHVNKILKVDKIEQWEKQRKEERARKALLPKKPLEEIFKMAEELGIAKQYDKNGKLQKFWRFKVTAAWEKAEKRKAKAAAEALANQPAPEPPVPDFPVEAPVG